MNGLLAGHGELLADTQSFRTQLLPLSEEWLDWIG
jgi:hypothetical protein